MRVMTVLGTRPEIIRLSRLIPQLDEACEHVLVHTGQNFDAALSDIFFRDLGVRDPDLALGIRGASFGEQVAQLLVSIEQVMLQVRPDRLLILGDTNSGLSALIAKRLGIPVYHMEAGNRCYDDRVPEETNRRLIDHSSDVLLPYTERSRANLLREGIDAQRVYVTGNPIREVIDAYRPRIDASTAFADLGVDPAAYFLVTIHRAENVDVPARLRALAAGLQQVQAEYDLPMIVSLHPRTRDRLESLGLDLESEGMRVMPPLGFFDFVALEEQAFCVLTDSGTVQEECCILRVPAVTVRDVTERPETIECGSNVLSGADPETIAMCVRAVTERRREWTVPAEYLAESVSQTVLRIVVGYRYAASRTPC
ncbi:MAG TPA: UDP-N-acetylglucosamine 2-epimerase (non-hydrolyzing) [Gemmatimonadaceae bacterium]|nr:UDP-N-acetylglucosamine 2-epimerase (non-hydrolyzing) [Gemmatimonadaceae bacterium]